MVEQDSHDITAVIREKIADGRLPTARPSRVWAGKPSRQLCAACDVVIEAPAIEYEVDTDRGTLRFHQKCFEVWHFERDISADDLRALAEVLTAAHTPLCPDCLAERLSVPVTRVLVLLDRMAGAVAVKRSLGPCGRCARHVQVFSIW